MTANQSEALHDHDLGPVLGPRLDLHPEAVATAAVVLPVLLLPLLRLDWEHLQERKSLIDLVPDPEPAAVAEEVVAQILTTAEAHPRHARNAREARVSPISLERALPLSVLELELELQPPRQAMEVKQLKNLAQSANHTAAAQTMATMIVLVLDVEIMTTMIVMPALNVVVEDVQLGREMDRKIGVLRRDEIPVRIQTVVWEHLRTMRDE